MKANLVIDLDGTLINDAVRHWTIFKTITKSEVELEDYWRFRRSGLTNAEVADHLKITSWDKSQFLNMIESKEFLSLDQPVVEVSTQVALKEKFRLILCTVRSNSKNCKWQLEQLGFTAWFDDIVIIDHRQLVASGKRYKADALTSLVEFSNSDIIIGDTEIDILTGKALGITTIAVDSGIRSIKYLSRYQPDRIADNINAINFHQL